MTCGVFFFFFYPFFLLDSIATVFFMAFGVLD
jgi:hypothetical protein